ncbi:unnamed protein product [Paramecium sonneborni]|uniref:Uncharacterized protein n=1 Tax=Paramecium sonneborni TaxID=65129 RepID=A0A8S1RSL9_9CILI|nr:unnamed protein product [Paramecium sonneborni]
MQFRKILLAFNYITQQTSGLIEHQKNIVKFQRLKHNCNQKFVKEIYYFQGIEIKK